jgi:lysophospholipase L1-like esterase
MGCRRAIALLFAACVVLLCALVSTAPASASAAVVATPTVPPVLKAAFAIDAGAAATNDRRVTVGDGGDSPFFSRGVLVWEGGSIIIGGSAIDGEELTRQTRALLDHTCHSYKSTSGNRTLADMIAQAPVRVDPHYDPMADANICVAMAGGGDLAAGGDPQAVLDALRTYCAARRAAGFEVVVLTLLPRSDTVGFDAARAVYNDMLRAQWPAFADGLADVAADPRIGADGANLDPVYFLDMVHPTSAGYAIMAAAVAPALEGVVWRSGAGRVRYSDPPGAWTGWRRYAEGVSWLLPAGDGVKTVAARYRDADGAVATTTAAIMLDTSRPLTRAGKAVARNGKLARLPFTVVDARPGSATATVAVVVKDKTGAAVLRLSCGTRRVNTPQTATFSCLLAKGTYRYFVYATDEAGNRQSRVGSAGLKVR